jgi:transposase
MKIESRFTYEELLELSKLRKYAIIAERLKAVAYALKGDHFELIAKRLSRSKDWVRIWVGRFLELEIQGLYDKPKSGQPKKLKSEHEEHFKQRVINGPQECDGGVSRFTGKILIEILKEEYQAEYKIGGVYDLLDRLGLSHIKSRARHPKNDDALMQKWKEDFPLLSPKCKTLALIKE